MFYGLMPEIKMDWIGLDWIMSDNARYVHSANVDKGNKTADHGQNGTEIKCNFYYLR